MSQTASAGIGDVLGDAGALPRVECGGKVWELGHPTQRAKHALEGLFADQAVTETTALKGVVSAAAYAELFADLAAAVRSGSFKTWGAGWAAAVRGPSGEALYVTALLRERHPDATPDDARRLLAERPDELQLALARVTPPFLSLLVACYPGPAGRRESLLAELGAAFRRPPTPSTPTPPG